MVLGGAALECFVEWDVAVDWAVSPCAVAGGSGEPVSYTIPEPVSYIIPRAMAAGPGEPVVYTILLILLSFGILYVMVKGLDLLMLGIGVKT